MPQAGRLGALPQDKSLPRLQLARALAPSYTPPPAVDHGTAIPTLGGMLNSDYGDCVAAGAGHGEQAFSFYGQGVEADIPDDAVAEFYAAICPGWQPDVPGDPNDNGATLQSGLKRWHRQGIAGHTVLAYAEVSTSSLREVMSAIALFGGLYAALQVPASAIDQFNNGQPWDVVADDGGNQGGHCTWMVAYDANGLVCVTWGQLHRMTWAFFARYYDEAWTVASQEWINAKGLSPDNVDTATLNADYTALTGKPGPFQPPTPAPTPPVPPGPPVVVDPRLVQARDLLTVVIDGGVANSGWFGETGPELLQVDSGTRVYPPVDGGVQQ